MPDQPSDSRDFLNEALRGPSSCPPIEALADAAASAELRRHLEACARCRTEVALLREFEAASPRPEERADVQWIQDELARRAVQIPHSGSDEPSGLRAWLAGLFGPRHRYAFSFAAAAALVVVIAAGVYFRGPSGGQLAAPGKIVWRSTQITALSPVGDIGSAPERFQWEPVPGAVSYRVELSGVDGATLWSGSSSTASLTMAPEVRAQFVPGRAFHWRVTGVNSVSATIATSDLQSFHILTTSR